MCGAKSWEQPFGSSAGRNKEAIGPESAPFLADISESQMDGVTGFGAFLQPGGQKKKKSEEGGTEKKGKTVAKGDKVNATRRVRGSKQKLGKRT